MEIDELSYSIINPGYGTVRFVLLRLHAFQLEAARSFWMVTVRSLLACDLGFLCEIGTRIRRSVVLFEGMLGVERGWTRCVNLCLCEQSGGLECYRAYVKDMYETSRLLLISYRNPPSSSASERICPLTSDHLSEAPGHHQSMKNSSTLLSQSSITLTLEHAILFAMIPPLLPFLDLQIVFGRP